MTELHRLTETYDELGIGYELREVAAKQQIPEGAPAELPVATVLKLPWVEEYLFDAEGNYLGTVTGEEIADFHERGESVETPEPDLDPGSFAARLRSLRSGPPAPSADGVEALAEKMSVGAGAWNRSG